MLNKRLFGGVALVAFMGSMPSLALAQESGDAQGDSVKVQEKVVVTAQRKEEVLQDVPVAISVYDDETRDRLGIRTIEDYANFTPGMNFSTSLDRISLRGVGRLTNTIGSDPGVATYNDGFYTASAAEASKTPMFVERIEILRGPQGTLYGRNSVGGALNVVSKRPTQEFEGELRTTFDQYAGTIFEGLISGPITDKLSARLSYQQGPMANDYPFENQNILSDGDEGALGRRLGELQLQYDFSDTTQLWFKYSHAIWSDHFRSANLRGDYLTTDVMPGGALVPNAAFGYTVANPGVKDPRAINTNTRADQALNDNHNFVVNFTTEFNDIAVKYVGGHSQYLYTAYSDLDYTPVDSVTTGQGTLSQFVATPAFIYTYNPTYIQEYIEDKTYYSNEVTFSNATQGAFNWIFGLYQYHEDFFQPVTWYQGGDGTDNMATALAAPLCLDNFGLPTATCASNPRRAFYAGSGDLSIDSYAAFGQVDWEFAPNWKLTAGLRYGQDDKTGTETYRLVNWNPTSPNASCFNLGCGPFTPALDLTHLLTGVPGSGPLERTLSKKFDGVTGRVALDYKPNEDTLLFASYARGIKSGGFNLGNYADSPQVDNEVVDAFEVGLKSRPFDELQFNATGFLYNYKDPQIPISVLRTGSSFTSTNFFNIPETQSMGLELEASWFPTNWLEVNASYAYLDTEVTKTERTFDDPTTPGTNYVDLKGNRLPQSSENQFAVSGLIDVPLKEGALFFAGSYIFRDSFYSSIFNTPQSEAPSFDRVDLRATYVVPNGNLTVIGYVRNVFDELGYDGVAAQTGTSSTGFGRIESYTTPRTYGVELQVKF